MSRKKKHAAHENHERWLVSYADFITLLFAFFVVMFATSQTDKGKAKQVSDSVREALENGGVPAKIREILGGTVDDVGKGNAMLRGPGGAQRAVQEAPQPKIVEQLVPSREFLDKELKDAIENNKLQIKLHPRGLVVSLLEASFFSSGEDTIDPSTYPILEKIAEAIRAVPNAVRLEGHTDSVPIHTPRFRSNWELSAARAIATLELLSGRFGVPRERMAVVGYADTVPVDTNATEEGRARNRRVDVVLLSHERTVLAEAGAPKPEASQGHADRKESQVPTQGHAPKKSGH
ncbi:MAG: hypothetical protein FJW37_00495 [Acidobacteria bacterium]|nr:hypothetical protein [Acidobacteriota bacterium]